VDGRDVVTLVGAVGEDSPPHPTASTETMTMIGRAMARAVMTVTPSYVRMGNVVLPVRWY
jgi:hypothetical protein